MYVRLWVKLSTGRELGTITLSFRDMKADLDDEAGDSDGSRLSDAVHSHHCLLLHCWIPPGVLFGKQTDSMVVGALE